MIYNWKPYFTLKVGLSLTARANQLAAGPLSAAITSGRCRAAHLSGALPLRLAPSCVCMQPSPVTPRRMPLLPAAACRTL